MSRPRLIAVAAIGVALALLTASAIFAQGGPPRDNPPPDEGPAVRGQEHPPGPPAGEPKAGPGPRRPGDAGPGGPDRGRRGPREGMPGQPGQGPHGPGMPGQMPGMMPGGMPGGMPGMPGPQMPGMPGMRGGQMPGMFGGQMPGGIQPGMMPQGPPRWPHPDWQEMERNAPELFRLMKEEGELERRTRELGIEYRGAPEPRREEIKKELTKLVNHQFEIRQERRQLELKRLDKEIQRLREAIERRMKARDELVGKRVRELLGEQEDTGF